jgi:DNA-directed RNA polymerase subunit H (RpoH/RPB5)
MFSFQIEPQAFALQKKQMPKISKMDLPINAFIEASALSGGIYIITNNGHIYMPDTLSLYFIRDMSNCLLLLADGQETVSAEYYNPEGYALDITKKGDIVKIVDKHNPSHTLDIPFSELTKQFKQFSNTIFNLHLLLIPTIAKRSDLAEIEDIFLSKG